ncbi:CUB and sushi domain-containing protein 1 isoform X2 [Pangasianodon hypophthalmus]|uniref:CUB and sushi domain-containing protein 1 isoform X2 n=1 Tax=Pangasianodon hypophthalmus TaxID=310915 RepID=UPI002307D2AA|nr:CUB and sushi domain-containing protein 1 isoform X2 [Pangasianodon hypophthalmus]
MRVKMSLWTLLLFLLAFVSRGKAGECPRPVPEGNVLLTESAMLKNNFPDGSEVTLKCATGYVVVQGSNTIQCVSGEWSKQELTCKKKDCGLPRSTPNMNYHIPTDTLFGAYIRPVCDRGYYLQGSSYRQCHANGWGGRSQCLLVTCGKLPEIPHSVIVSEPAKEIIGFGDVIEYSCEDKYTLVGNRSVVCQENGNYSSLPQCQGECPRPVPEGNVLLTESAMLKNNFPDGSEVTLKCATGYVVVQGSNTIQCVSGEWSKQELTCKKKDCGLPRSTPNMNYHILTDTLFGAYIRPVCDRGYYLQGSSYRQCHANGWGGRSQCLLVTCGKLPEIPHSVIVSEPAKEIIGFGDVIEYSCEDKYTLVGNRSVVCQENGNYSSLPQCQERQGHERYFSTYFVIGLTAILAAAIAIVILIWCLVQRYQKRKGSYDTGEEMRKKEALMQENCYSNIRVQSKAP